MKKRKKSAKKRADPLKYICWGVIPTGIAICLVTDALGFYVITDAAVAVIGICITCVMLPFFGEVKIKDVLLKRNNSDKGENE